MGVKGPAVGTIYKDPLEKASYRKSFRVSSAQETAQAQRLNDRISTVLHILEFHGIYPSSEIDENLRKLLITKLEEAQSLICSGIAKYNDKAK